MSDSRHKNNHDERSGKWHTGPDVAAYVELNREWGIKWMMAESEKEILMGLLALLLAALDGGADDLAGAKANARAVLKTMGGE